MEGGMMVAKSSSSSSSSPVDTTSISILVVDDDNTCLTIIAAILKRLKYKVVTVKKAMDALYTLRAMRGAFDLVVSDVHMPDMNGFDLQRIITEEFNLPVVLMSADEKESIASRSLEGGAVFFLFKPISQHDLKDLWQFAATYKRRRNRNVFIKRTPDLANTSKGKQVLEEETTRFSVYDGAMSTSRKETKKRNPREEDYEEKYGGKLPSLSKRPKVVWTISLHHRFLNAINSIGLDKAVPKNILAVMNVPGLTRENVASHLQKYRIFLRRVSEASFKVQYAHHGLNIGMNSSSDETERLMLSKIGKLNYNFPNSGNFDLAAPLQNLDAQSTLYGQSRLLSNIETRYSHRSPMGSSTLAPSHPSVLLAPNSYGARASNPFYMPNLGQNHYFSDFASSSLSQNSVGSSNVMLPPRWNMTYQTNYNGYNLSNVQSSESFMNNNNTYGGSTSTRGIPSFFREDPQPSMGPGPISFADNFEAINNSQKLLPNVADHMSFDVADILESTLSPIVDLPEFNTASAQQGLGEGLETAWPEQVTNVLDPPPEGDFGGQTNANSNILFNSQGDFRGQTNTNSNILFNSQGDFGGQTNTSSNILDDVVLWDTLLNSSYPFEQTQNQQVGENSSAQLETTNTQGIAAASQINEVVIEPNNVQLTFENFLNTSDFGAFPQLNNNVPSPNEVYINEDFLNSLFASDGEDIPFL